MVKILNISIFFYFWASATYPMVTVENFFIFGLTADYCGCCITLRLPVHTVDKPNFSRYTKKTLLGEGLRSELGVYLP